MITGLNVAKLGDRMERMRLLKENLDFTCTCCLCKEIDDSWIDVD